jgi:GNAT superfamily N-acetyltransferase
MRTPSILRIRHDQDRRTEIVCSPRDMVVALQGFSMPDTSVIGDIVIRRANLQDYESVVTFVKANFGDRWLSSVHNGFQQTPIPIFIARLGDQILGFACYDVVQMKKGVFGPMGTSPNYRQKGLGKALLHHCLSEMQRNGYAYAIIDNAGPLEFYETACGAVVIPKY